MKQLILDNASEQFVPKDKLEQYIKNSLIIVVSKKVKTVYIVKMGGFIDYVVYKDGVVNGNCSYDSLFQYYNVYLFGTNHNIKLTNVNNNDVYDEFREAVKSNKKIAIAKEKEYRGYDTSYIVETNKDSSNHFVLRTLRGNPTTGTSIEWIFKNLDVFVLDISK